jgi:D-alanyl-D-alanine carboxypeptidase
MTITPARSIILLALLAISLAACGGGSTSTPSSPPSGGANQAHMLLAQVGTPALAVSVASSTQTLSSSVAGLRIATGTAQVSQGDLWHLGSNVKAMTAALAGVMVQRGQIAWDTTIGQVFPDLTQILPVYQPATLEDLLSHRAGVVPLTDLSELAKVPPFTGDLPQQRIQLVEWALAQPPIAPPGTTFVYSNAGYVVAAAMLERITGQAWEQAIIAQVLTPLGIFAKIGWPGTGDPNQPWGHIQINGQWIPNDPNVAANQFPGLLNPAGNLSMSVDDDTKWATMNLRGLEGVDSPILTAATIQKLHTPVGVPAGQPGYALGWEVEVVDGHLVSFHQGSAGTFVAEVAVDSQRDRTVAVLANGGGDAPLAALDLVSLQLLSQ